MRATKEEVVEVYKKWLKAFREGGWPINELFDGPLELIANRQAHYFFELLKEIQNERKETP